MKKFLLSASSCLLLFCISCSNKDGGGKISEAAQKNLDGMHAINKSFETGDFSKLGDYIATDAVDHAGENGDVKGLDSIKASLIRMAGQMSNSKSEIIKELADDEYVMAWMRNTGVCKVDMMGMKAGDKIDMEALEVARYKDGKAVEHWSFMSTADMMKMMPQPAMDNKMMDKMKDTTMKKM